MRKHDDAPLPYEAAGSATTQKGISIYGNRAGMLIGKLHMGTVEQCFAKGRIIPHEKDPGYEDISDGYLGGLISSVAGTMGDHTSGSVSNCYAQVDIIREQYNDAKGYAIIGSGVSKNNHYCEVTFANCYGAGICSQGNNIATTYYDKELVAKPGTDTSAKSSFSMRTMSNYAGWDFETVWARNDDYNDGYPVLRIFHPGIENSPDPVMVTGITLQETNVDIMIGDSIQLHAAVVPADAADQHIMWSSNKPTIAPVDENGFVRVGILNSTSTVVITATTEDGGFAKNCTLNVKIPNIYNAAVLKSRRIGDPEWQKGNNGNAKYTLNWEYIVGAYTSQPLSYVPFTWQSSDESVLTVSSFKDDTALVSSGNTYRASLAVVHCVVEGTSTITVANPKYDGISAQRTYTVLRYDPTGITASVASTTLGVGESGMVNVQAIPAATSYPVDVDLLECTFASSDPAVLGVDTTGRFTALAAGSAYITVTYGTLNATTETITVSVVEAQSITINEYTGSNIEIREGETFQLTATVLPENTTDKTVTWESSNTNYATVDQNGLVTAVEGSSYGNSVTIYARSSKRYVEARAYFKIKDIPVEDVILNTHELVVYIGESLQLEATVLPKNASSKSIYWSTTNNSAVKVVSGTGVITAKAAGTADIVARAGDSSNGYHYDTCHVTVKPVPIVPDCKSLPFSESFASNQGEFTIENVTLDGLSYVWKFASGYGMKASAYVSSVNHPTESWLISPCLELPEDATINLTFDHVYRYTSAPSTDLTLLVSENYLDGAPSTATWTPVAIPTYSSGSNWTFVNAGNIDLSAYAGKNVTLAFRYKSSSSAAATWEIKNVSVTSSSISTTGLDAALDSHIATKCIINDHLFILRDGHKFTVTGTMVE